MINTKYAVAVKVTKPADHVFRQIINLKNWWVEEFTGEEPKLNSEFVLKSGDGHFSKNKVIEFVPDKKFTWITIESKRVADNFDWTGTKMIFELASEDDNTIVTFTYDGIVPENQEEQLKEICNYCIRNLLYNYLESFTATIEVTKSPQEVFKIITSDVSKWWGGKDLTGSSTKLNDEFVVHHKGAHFSKQKLIEVIPENKNIWQVAEGTLHWLPYDQQEWKNTKMIFEISSKGNKTVLHFTHYGLVPAKECYAKCEQGWTMVIKDWLFHYITEGHVNERLL